MSAEIERFCTLMLSSATRVRLYGLDHSLTEGSVDELVEVLDTIHTSTKVLRLAVAGGEIFFDEHRIDATAGPTWALVRRLAAKGIGLLELHQGVRREELLSFLEDLADAEATSIRGQPHIAIGTAELDIHPGDSGTEVLRVRDLAGKRNDEISDEARQLVQVTRHVREHYEVRAKDFKEIALSLVSRFTQQDNLFFNLAEVRDHNLFTYLHTCNVASHSIGFSLALGTPPAVAFEMGVAALLHDIGKNFVPEGILNKPAKLTDEEWKVIRLHPVEGARILLRQSDVSHLAVVVAYEHHMHFGGSGGYPRSTKRPSLQSQLVAVADTFDALFGKRSYHRRYDVVEALEVLQADAGTVYNPELVDEFCRYVTTSLEEAEWVA